MRKKNAILNIISDLLLKFIVIIYGFIVPKLIIESFGSSVNGLVSSITNFLAYIVLLESGFGPVVKAALYKPIASKDQKSIQKILKATEVFFRKIAFIFILYVIALCFLYPLIINDSFNSLYTISLIIIISISTFFEYFFGMTYRLYLHAKQKIYVTTYIYILTNVLSIISVIILVKLHFSIHIIKLISGIIFVLRPLLQNLYVKKKYNISFKNVDGKYELKQKWDGLVQHIAAVIHVNTDITVLSFFSSLIEVSVYTVYYMVVKGVRSIILAFTNGIDALFGDMIAKKESDNLIDKFDLYELLYINLITVIFTCTMLLITPFISVYIRKINDANYIRYTFGFLLVISEYIWAIREPYSSITLAAGHFKETKKGALVECIVNVVLSVILVWKYGIVGVTIGTIVAMAIRTIEFIYHANKYILKRNITTSIKKIMLLIFETILVVIIAKNISIIDIISVSSWFVNAIVLFIISTIIVIIFNFIFYKDEMKNIIGLFKKTIKSLLLKKRRKKINNDDFTIISNNCWGGAVYEFFGLQKKSPTVGLYFFADDYIKFVYNLKHYLSSELKFINVKDSKHYKALKVKNQLDVPIGKLDDIEIVFLHYKDPVIAKQKFEERCKRINWDNIIIKFSYMNECTEKHLEKFSKIKGVKKVLLVGKNNTKYEKSYVVPTEENGQISNDIFYINKRVKIYSIINEDKTSIDDIVIE